MYPQFLDPLQPYAQQFLEELAKKEKEARQVKKWYKNVKTYKNRRIQRKDTLMGKYLSSPSSLNKEYDHYLDSIKKELHAIPNAVPSKKRTSTTDIIGTLRSPRKMKPSSSNVLKCIGGTNENEALKKTHELINFKKEHVKKLGKIFSNMTISTRKAILPRVAAAVFGEAGYEIEILKYAQANHATNNQ